MPPKNKKQQENEDFDQMLKELQTKTKEAGQSKQKKAASNPDKRAKHKELKAAINKAKEAEFERAMERQAQQQQISRLIEQMRSQANPFLDAPKTDIESSTISNELFDAATAAMQGWRRQMEDAHCTDVAFSPNEKAGLFGVFDGHSGSRCSQVARLAVPALAKKFYEPTEVSKGAPFLSKVFSELDHSLKDKCGDGSGSTACVVLVTASHIVCANCGDSRAVLCRGGKTIELSHDHKPENPEETARIQAAGGHVESNRVNGELAMSRAIGDFRYKQQSELPDDKQLVIAVPEIIHVERDKSDEFVIVACDGIWDVLSNEEAVEFVRTERKTAKTLEDVAKSLTQRCLAPAGPTGQPSRPMGTDNMTVTIVALK